MRRPSGDFLGVVFSDLTVLSSLGVDVGESMWNPTKKNLQTLSDLFDQVFISFACKPLYPTLVNKAANLLYLIANDHKFENGNKRTAVVSMLILLAINNSWLNMSPDSLHDLVVEAVESTQVKEAVVKRIEDALHKDLVNIHLFTQEELAVLTKPETARGKTIASCN